MGVIFTYPTNYELTRIGQLYVAKQESARPLLQLFPTVNSDAGKVRWTQKDTYYGMQQLRGLDGQPAHIFRVGQNVYEYEPGVFGEFASINEAELTTRAGSIQSGEPISIADLVVEAQEELLNRELTLKESVIASLITTGTWTVSNANMTWTDTFSIQTARRAVDWRTSATATPLVDFRGVQQKSLGYSVRFDGSAKAYLNRATANSLLNNTNTADIGGRRNAYGATVNSIPEFSRILLGEDLPQLVVCDDGYYATKAVAGTGGTGFTKYLPDGYVVIIGGRTTGEPVGEYKLTRNMVNGGQPGSYSRVVDTTQPVNGVTPVPPKIDVHRGHNGGPVLYFPSAIVAMTVWS